MCPKKNMQNHLNQSASKNLLTAAIMINALKALDQLLTFETTLIVGGGGAMILAHHYPLATTDIDAIPRGMDLSVIGSLLQTVAHDLSLPHDWLNPYFGTFTHTLPADYGDRLITVFNGKYLKAQALGGEEMLIMKCFASRQKDVGHAKALIKNGVDTKRVEKHIETLLKKRIPGAQNALDFLDDLKDQL